MGKTPDLIKSAIKFVESVELPARDTLEDAGISIPQTTMPDFKLPGDMVIAVGSQIAGFAASVDPAIRPHITNAFLLAQLAANKKISTNTGTSNDWYKTYLDVLRNIGWVVEGDADSLQVINVKGFDVRREILPIIQAALGPVVAATTLITKVLASLENMSKDAPWITLFHHESQRAKANQFQFSNTTGTTNNPSIKLVGFELKAAKSVTQVLLFKFASNNAELRKFESTLTVNTEMFKRVQGAIELKLGSRIANYVAGIHIE